MHASFATLIAGAAALGGRPLGRAAALLAAITLGCSGSEGSGGVASGGPGPTGLYVYPIAEPLEVQLYWTAPDAPVDGYELEAKIGSGSFQVLNATPLGDWVEGHRYVFPKGSPDLVDWVFRVRGLRRGRPTAYSNEVAFHRGVSPPLEVTVRFDWTEVAPVLLWERNSTAATGVRVERRAYDALGRSLGEWTELAVSDPAAPTYVDHTATMNARYVYRVANVAGDAVSVSAYSGQVVAGLAAPAPFTAHFDVAEDAVSLTLSSVPADADGLRLERLSIDATGQTIGDWETVTLPAGLPTAFLDRTWPEDTRLAYRISALHGAYASDPASWTTQLAPRLYRPIDLAATSVDGGVELTWTNRSTRATELELYWSPQVGETTVWSSLATLAPTETRHLATSLAPGYYKLWVRATNGATSSQAVIDYTTPNAPGALSLESAAVAGSAAADAAPLPGGGWAYLSVTPELAIWSPGDPFPRVTRPDADGAYAPVLLVDPAGRPHAFYAAAGTGGASVLKHLWFDGAAWQSEPVLEGVIRHGYLTALGFDAALDAAGNPQVLAVLEPAGSPDAIVLARKQEGAWITETVPVTSFDAGSQRVTGFGLDLAGNPHLAVHKTEWARDAEGAWRSARITDEYGSWFPQDAAWIGPDDAVVLAYAFGSDQLAVLEKVNGAWQAARLLADERGYVYDTFRMAASADRSRVGIVHASEVGVRTYHREAGVWHTTLVAPPRTAAWLRIGFDASRRAQVLLRRASDYLDLREP